MANTTFTDISSLILFLRLWDFPPFVTLLELINKVRRSNKSAAFKGVTVQLSQ